MTSVILKMNDLFNEKQVEREIDISNLYVPNYNAPLNFEHDILGTPEQQRKNLEQWIKERGNQQHDTLLELVSWEII